MDLEFWLCWYWAGFYALLGIALFLCRRRFTLAEPEPNVSCLPAAEHERLRAATARRASLESLPGPAMATWIAAAALVAAILVVLTPVPPILVYALFCVVFAVTTAYGYFRLRLAGRRRIASLRARTPRAAVPEWMTAAAVVTAISPLAYVDVAPLAATIVTAAGLGVVAVGVFVSQLPALLSGDDPPVEAYLDDRVRALRSLNLIAGAPAPAYVFDAFTTLSNLPGTGLHWTAMFVAAIAGFAASMLQITMIRRRPGALEIERWSRLGV